MTRKILKLGSVTCGRKLRFLAEYLREKMRLITTYARKEMFSDLLLFDECTAFDFYLARFTRFRCKYIERFSYSYTQLMTSAFLVKLVFLFQFDLTTFLSMFEY